MLNQLEQQTVSTGKQVYMLCKNCGYKQNLKPSDLADPTKVICQGQGCNEVFSVREGIKNAITSDNDFLSWCFISDTMISARDTVTIGTVKEIKLETPIKAAKKVFVMQATPLDSGDIVYFEHKVILPETLIIISSGNSESVGRSCEVSWVVYADVESEQVETWREYLRHAKESLINNDFQSAIVEAEIAVEVTLANVLWELLTKRKKLSSDVAEWILSKVQATSERAKKVMELAIGKKVSDINPIIYKSWVKNVAQKRNRIVHHGESATREEALEAIGTAFDFVWLLLELVNKKPVRL